MRHAPQQLGLSTASRGLHAASFPFSTPFQAPSGPIDARKVALSAFYHLLSCRAARVSSTSMHWTALPAPHKAVAARVRRSCATVSRRKPCRPWRSTCHAGLGRARSDEASQRNQASLGMVSESSRAARSQPASRARGKERTARRLGVTEVRSGHQHVQQHYLGRWTSI